MPPKKDDKFYDEIFKVELGDKYGQFDETTLEYCLSVVKDLDSDEGDMLQSLAPLLQGVIENEDEAETVAKKIVQKSRGDVVTPSVTKKVLNAPVRIAAVIDQHAHAVEESLKSSLPSVVNYNRVMQDEVPNYLGELTITKKSSVVKRNQKEIAKEMAEASAREAILKKLVTKPVKFHESGKEDPSTRQKDIHLEEISLILNTLELLKDVTITISQGHRYGLIGRNGMGKSTFLKFLSAKMFPGIPKNLQIVHIEQEVGGDDVSVLDTVLSTDTEREALLKESQKLQEFMEALDKGITMQTEEEYEKMTPEERSDLLAENFNRLEEIGADAAPQLAASILAGLGFDDKDQLKATKDFSGGWRMRIAIAQALFIQPDILLLDEPTNHLDLHSVMWLEDYLLGYDRTLIIVSHDKKFLNNVTTDIILLKNKKLAKYKGNYDSFEKQVIEERKRDEKALENQKAEIKKLEDYIDKNLIKTANSIAAKSRQKVLAKIKDDLLPEIVDDPTFSFSFPEADNVEGAIITLVEASFGYSPNKILFKNVNLDVNMESRIALVGSNGAGKSTLLKLILGELQPTSGEVKINKKARIARFTQHHVDQLDLSKTPLESFQDLYPLVKPQEIRNHLALLGIAGNLPLQPIHVLSGGQKSRVAFAHITWKKPHLLLLDEPSNHLDMDTVDALIRACTKWNGGLLIVSHDEHLITQVCDTIWSCSDNTVRIFPGEFSQYKQHISAQKSDKVPTIKH